MSEERFPYERRPGLNYSVIQRSWPENPRNDTASVTRMGDGSLMAAWHQYRATERGTSDFGRCDIASKKSHDGGVTWTDERILVETAEGDNNVQAPALRRLRDGNLLLTCLRGHAGGQSSSMSVFRSRDDGRRFAQIGFVWERSEGQWLQGGASSLLELKSGRLLMPVHGGSGHQATQHNVACVYLSDDGGSAWRRSEQPVDLSMRGAMEASVAELSGGTLAMSLRTQLGAVFIAWSADRGETWSVPQTTGLKAPESCTSLRAIPGTDELLLLWNDSLYDPQHHHYGVRTPLTLGLSADRGMTWKRICNLAHADGYNFTNLGCDFVDEGQAVVTYCCYGPNEGFSRRDGREVWPMFDLHTVIIDREWVYRKST